MTYVALLRGIAPMDPNMRNPKLRGVLEGLGFQNVRSVISSGNVVFDVESDPGPSELEAMIEASWPEKLGFTSTTILRTRDELERLIAAQPFEQYPDLHSSRLNVTFLKHSPSVELAVPYTADGFVIPTVVDRAVCSAVITDDGARTPDVMRWLERTYGKQITTRTWKTVHRIVRAMTLLVQ